MAPLSFFGGLYANGRDALSRRDYRARCRRPSDGRAKADLSNGHDGRTGSDPNRKEEELAMGAEGIVVQPSEGLVQNFTPGRFLMMKLQGVDTADSVMLFEETAPPGTKSWFHLHPSPPPS